MATIAAANALKRHLGEHLDWHGARLMFLAQFLLALFEVKTVNLAQVATALSGRAEIASNYKRLQRFFRHFTIDQASIARLVIHCLPVGERWYLSLDRTNWQFGKTEINILVLGVVYQGTAFPLFWHVLGKAGNSNAQERIALMNRYLDTFSSNSIQALLADREFIGKVWLSYLHQQSIPFRMRLKANLKITNHHGVQIPLRRLFPNGEINQFRCLEGQRFLGGVPVFISGCWLDNDETLFIASNAEPETALDDYAKRWGIETLFGSLKTRGFGFEDTHLRDPDRISKLVALLTIAFAWAHRTGEWRNEIKPIPIKRFKKKLAGRSTRSSATVSISSAS